MNKNLINLILTEPTFLYNSKRLIGDAILNIISKQISEPISQQKFIESIQIVSESNSTDEISKYVAIIPIHGVVYRDGWGSTSHISALLKDYENDPNNIGVVFWSKTPGGSASGTGQLAHQIFEYSKPKATFMDFLCCSAGMYLAGPTDKRFVNKHGDWIGSIGTMASMLDMIPLLESFGAKYWEMYADGSEDKNKSWRDLINENDETLFKEELNSYRDEFVNDMKLFMPNLKEEVFSGKIYRPADAIKNGLADEFGTLESAVKWVFSQSNQESNNQNSNQNNMSDTKKFIALAAVLGVASIEAKKGFFDKEAKANFSLTESQLDSLEKALESSNVEKVQELENQLTTAQEAQSTAETNLTNLQTSIGNAMKSAKLKDKGSDEENIAELSAKVVEFGARKDTKPTNVNADKEVIKDDEDPEEYASLKKVNVNEL